MEKTNAKKIALYSLLMVGTFLSSFFTVQAVSILIPQQGGTGTGVAPTLGQVLVGQSNGNYLPQATSTLGISGGGSATPGGASSTIQYNANGAFNGNTGLVYTGTNVGIGTTTPSDLLSVSGNAYFATNVGIGTNNPRGSLDVSAVGPTNFFLGNGALGDNQLIILNGGRSTIGYSGAFQGTEINGSQKPVEITTGTAFDTGQVAYFGTNGFVGLGSSTPFAQLSINPTTSLGTAPAISVGSSTGSIFAVSNIGNVTIPCTGAGAASTGAGYRFNGTASGFSCLSSTDIRFAIAGSNDPLRITNTGVFVNTGLTVGDIAAASPSNGLYVVGNSALGTTTPVNNNRLAVQGNQYLSGNLFVGGAITATSTLTLSALGTPAGAFLAVSPTGQVIATTTPSGGSGVTSVTGTYPVISSGGLTPAISLAFGTTTANSWTGLQQFNGGASTTNFTNTGSEWLTSLANPAGSFIAVDPAGKIIATTTPTGSSSAFSPAANYATTGVLAGYTYTAGVITEVGTGALSVDGANPTVGQTVLVKNESGACTSSSGGCNNGLYNVTAAGSGIAAFVLTRNSNYNSSSNVIPGIVTYVISGTVNADDFWAMTSAAPITVGTTALTYAEVSGGGASVTSVSNSDSSLTISPTAGAVVASVNTAHANNWTALQQFAVSSTSVASHTGTTFFGATATTTINADGNGSIVVPSAGSITDTGLGTPAGTFLAAGPTGLIGATSTPGANQSITVAYTASTTPTITWTAPAGLRYATIECIGGGGSGGTGANQSYQAGGGGGGGGYSKVTVSAATLGASQTVIVGNGAAGVTSSGASGQKAGLKGNSTSFGTFCSSSGGLGGNATTATQAGGANSGGIGTAGDIQSSGDEGAPGVLGTSGNGQAGGKGGYSEYGFGQGGNGSISTNTSSAGSPGAVIVTEYF